MSRIRLLTAALLIAKSIAINAAYAKTYEQYLDQLAQHPSVTHLEQQSFALDALAKSAGGLPDPQIVLGIDNVPVNDPKFDRYLATSKVIGFKQAIPNRAARNNKTAMQQNQSNQQRLIAAYQLERLKAVFTHKLIELEKVNQLEQLLKDQLNLYQLMETDLRGQLEAGHSVYGRFAEIDVERSEIEQRLNDLKAERVYIRETLIELVETVPDVSLPEIKARHWVRSETPLYPTSISQQEISINDSKIHIAKADFKPSYGLQALYKQRESSQSFDGDDWFSLQASISVPLWSRSNQTPKLTAARAAKQSAQFAHEQSTRQWNTKMASLRAEQKYALENIQLLKQKQASITEMIAAAQRNYESGNVALETVLDAQINHQNITARLITQQSRYNSLIVEFNSHIMNNDSHVGETHATH